MANVKYTTNNGEILTTSCKRLSTALRRFTAFLKEYDRYYNEMLSELNSENVIVTRDTCDTETVTITLTNDTDTYTLTIKHNTKVPDTVWSICTQDGEIKGFTDRKELFKYAYENNLCDDFDEVWIEEKELKDITHKYYETVDYESLDLYKVRSMLELDICDTDTTESETSEQSEAEQSEAEQTEATKQLEHNKKYIVRVFKNEKELMMLCHYFPKREYAIDYINKLCENGVVSSDVVFTINNGDIYDCFSDVKMSGTTAQIKYATDILNAFYKQLCVDIAFEYKIRINEDIDIESKDFYANINTYITILKKVLNGNCAKAVITNRDKFEVWGNVYRTANNFIIAYNDEKPNRILKHLESKMRKELFADLQILF